VSVGFDEQRDCGILADNPLCDGPGDQQGFPSHRNQEGNRGCATGEEIGGLQPLKAETLILDGVQPSHNIRQGVLRVGGGEAAGMPDNVGELGAHAGQDASRTLG
jgi:hypothetical protein